MRMALWASVLALACAVSGSVLAQEPNFALTRAQHLFAQMQQDSACEATLPEARSFAASADFEVLSADSKSSFLYRILNCAIVLGDGHAAIEAANAAHGLGADWADAMRAALGIDYHDDALAVQGFLDLAQSQPDQFRTLRTTIVMRALAAARRTDPSGATALRMHNLLVAQHYMPPEGGPDDAIRMAHARLLIASGDVATARQRLQGVTNPQLILELRIDKTFDALRGDAAFDRRLDLVAAANESLARARTSAANDPRRLALVLDVAQSLRALGRTQEALDVLDHALVAAQRPDADKNFDDLGDQLNWLLNEKAYILYDLNRVEEAHAVFGSSIAVGEQGGHWSVSQVINFGSMLNDEGRGADALEVVRTVGRASPYGDMWAAAVRACGAELSHNAAVRDEAMAFLRAHESDNVAALSQGLLCVNDLDGAAALYVRRLGDTENRADALLALQRYLPRDNSSVPHRALLLQRLATVRDRPDVRAAVDAVGRIEDVPLYTTYWGDV